MPSKRLGTLSPTVHRSPERALRVATTTLRGEAARSRCWHLTGLASCVVAVVLLAPLSQVRGDVRPTASKPNFVFLMSDDQGWGDASYQGHPHLRTPHLDAMAKGGVRFHRFYAGAPVCSPTRGSCLTGRHPMRYGIPYANKGHLPAAEVTLAEVATRHGYLTGHFGKWHLGTLTTKVKDSNRGGPGNTHYAPPWEHGFAVSFSTEAKVPTWDPMRTPNDGKRRKNETRGQTVDSFYGTRYWSGPEMVVTDNLDGDDSRVIMDRVIPFVEKAVTEKRPFLAVVWFHTPHLPVVAGPEYLERYVGHGKAAAYYGCISAMDDQIGRLRRELRRLEVAENTLLWFASDNGPEGNASAPGLTRELRGRKRSLYEGGVRVPGILEWPAEVRRPRTVSAPCSTLDYLPTLLALLGEPSLDRPLDGIDLLPLIRGQAIQRRRPLPFESSGRAALVGDRFKLVVDVRPRRPNREEIPRAELYDLIADPGESADLSEKHPAVLTRMLQGLEAWRESHQRSRRGADYAN